MPVIVSMMTHQTYTQVKYSPFMNSQVCDTYNIYLCLHQQTLCTGVQTYVCIYMCVYIYICIYCIHIYTYIMTHEYVYKIESGSFFSKSLRQLSSRSARLGLSGGGGIGGGIPEP